MRTLGLRERVYTELKWLANFKTGQVQQFSNRVVTYQFLANLITVPTTQGRAAGTMNAKEACRVLMKLKDAGLVSEITNDPKGGLQFALPMSPICKDTAKAMREAELAEAEEAAKTTLKLPIEAAKNAPKLPIQPRLKNPANPITTGVSRESTPPLSVMKNFKEVRTIFILIWRTSWRSTEPPLTATWSRSSVRKNSLWSPWTMNHAEQQPTT